MMLKNLALVFTLVTAAAAQFMIVQGRDQAADNCDIPSDPDAFFQQFQIGVPWTCHNFNRTANHVRITGIPDSFRTSEMALETFSEADCGGTGAEVLLTVTNICDGIVGPFGQPKQTNVSSFRMTQV